MEKKKSKIMSAHTRNNFFLAVNYYKRFQNDTDIQ